jgi:putative tricarboxylic transport membrane protein
MQTRPLARADLITGIILVVFGLGDLIGIIIGALPGLTATMGVALMTTLTIKHGSEQAMLVLVCIYVGAIYGGSRSAILLNIPRHAGLRPRRSTAFRWRARDSPAGDGHLHRRLGGSAPVRHAGARPVAPMLGEFALSFGSYEFFWLALFGIVIAGTLTAAIR